MRLSSFAFLFFLASPFLPLQAGHDPSVPRALFFSEPHFRGECLVVEAGGEIRDLAKMRDSRGRKWDDRIASVRIEGGARAVLWEDPRFRGERCEIQRQNHDLTERRRGETGLETWYKRASALRVEFHHEPEDQRPYRSVREADKAIHKAFRQVLGRDPDYLGLQHYRGKLLDQGWDYEELVRNLRAGTEFRGRDFEGIVRRIYKKVLHRDPDSNGLRVYVSNLRDRGWSEEDLRRALRESHEGRTQVAEEIVRRAYKEILGREPDPTGLETYVRKVRDGLSERSLRDHFRNSEEYRQRPNK